MVDMSLIQGTISSLKFAGDIAKSFLELKTISEVRGKVIELQNAILSAQNSALAANATQASMIEEVRTLKEEIAVMKAWGSDKQRYKLISPWSGTVVYSLQESMSNSEPPHWICTNCYDDGRKSILAQQQDGNSFVSFLCPRCNAGFRAVGRHSRGYNLKYA
jgi:hypothetical protein